MAKKPKKHTLGQKKVIDPPRYHVVWKEDVDDEPLDGPYLINTSGLVLSDVVVLRDGLVKKDKTTYKLARSGLELDDPEEIYMIDQVSREELGIVWRSLNESHN